MLERLLVSNLAIVEKADVEFSRGLNVLTGETGSGKRTVLKMSGSVQEFIRIVPLNFWKTAATLTNLKMIRNVVQSARSDWIIFMIFRMRSRRKKSLHISLSVHWQKICPPLSMSEHITSTQPSGIISGAIVGSMPPKTTGTPLSLYSLAISNARGNESTLTDIPTISG